MLPRAPDRLQQEEPMEEEEVKEGAEKAEEEQAGDKEEVVEEEEVEDEAEGKAVGIGWRRSSTGSDGPFSRRQLR